MKVSIIHQKCIACGLCQTYSKLFDYHDDGIVKFADSEDLETVVPNSDQDALTAIRSCPTKALTIL